MGELTNRTSVIGGRNRLLNTRRLPFAVRTKQKQPIDKDQEKDNYDTCNISIRVFVFYDTVYYNVNN